MDEFPATWLMRAVPPMEMAVARTRIALMLHNIRMMVVPQTMSPRRSGYLFVYRWRPLDAAFVTREGKC